MTCDIDECHKKAVKRGWCDTHYQRWRRRGGDLSVDGRVARARREWEAAGRPHGTYLSRKAGCTHACCVPGSNVVRIPEGWRQSA